VTAIKDAEVSLRHSEARLRAIADNMPVLIAYVDADQRYRFNNQTYQSWFGIAPREIFGRHMRDVFGEDNYARARTHIDVALAGKKVNFEGVLGARGVRRQVDVTYIPQLDELGKVLGFYILTADITERKAVERMKSEFVANVSHELRTPLTAIIGSLGVIQSDMLDEVPQHMKVFLDRAAQNSDRLASLINDILDTEKIESGLISLELQPVPVSAFLQQAISLNHGYADKLGVGFELRQPVPDVRLRADSGRLMQVLTNLLSNAAKFSPTGASVAVSARQIDDKIRVSVSDRGPGVPEEFRGRIFQKFAQADSSSTRPKGGTGLGLSISKAIIETMGGSLGYESVAGQGATFYFELPQWRERSALITADGRDRRVLICEDERDIANSIAVYLKRAGFDSDTAYSASQAKQLLAQHEYCAMTVDLVLPDEHGASLIRAVRATPATALLPIMIVSAETSEARAALAHMEASVSGWVDKPFTRQRLVDALERALALLEH